MLEAASKVQTDNATSHVLTLLDHFTLHGPNGTHSVLVTDVVGLYFRFYSQNAPHVGANVLRKAWHRP